MTAKNTFTLIWEWHECEKFQAFWNFFFAFMGYKTHSCSLSYLMGCGIFKTPWNICSAFKHILESELKFDRMLTLSVVTWRQCLLPHMELISIDAIKSVRIKSLNFSPALGWCRSRDWMCTKAINHRHGVPLLENLFEKFPHPYAVPQNHARGKCRGNTELSS